VHHRSVCIGAVALSCLLPASPALAQTSPSVPPKSVVEPQVGSPGVQAVQARREVLFQAMLARPDDLDAAFEYAALSAQVGDLEAAISTLERMLIFAPGLPRLQLELGVLYYRMGAFETARLYFEGAISGPGVPPEVQSKVDDYLAGIDGATETTRFSGQVRAGIRYQTNANRAPTDSIILLNGVPFTLSGSSLGSPDGNVYASGVFHVSHALPTQGDSLELDLVTYGSKQFERDELDVALAELTFGPAFDLGRFGIENAAIGVYGIASGVVLGGDFYSSAIGAGSRLVVRPNSSTSLLGAVEYRRKEYDNSDTYPAAELRDGDEVRAYGTGTWIMSPNLVLAGSAYVQRVSTELDFLSYTEGGLAIGPRFSFESPVSDEMRPWIASLNVGAIFREYDEPDPVISIFDAESDREIFVGGGVTIPLEERLALIAEAEYRWVDSNYDTRNFDNFTISLSLAQGF
jgi:hypothetical protein